MTDPRKVNGSRREERAETAGTDHPVYVGLERSRGYVHRGQSEGRRNWPSAGSVGSSVIVGGIDNRDGLRNTSLKRMIDRKHRTRKARRRKLRLEHSCPLLRSQRVRWKSDITVCTPTDRTSQQDCPRSAPCGWHRKRPSPSWTKLSWHWPLGGTHLKLRC
jgi:hypothetical protein